MSTVAPSMPAKAAAIRSNRHFGPVFSKISCSGVPAMQARDLCGIKLAFVTVSLSGMPAMPAKDQCGNVAEACRSMIDPFSYLLPWPAACRQ